MFKNQNTFTAQAANSQRQDLSQEKDLKIEDIPIHTMAKDIEEIEHPEKQVSEKTEIPAALSNATEKQQSSPFFNAPTSSNQKPQPQAPKHSFFGSLFGLSLEESDAQAQKLATAKKIEAEKIAAEKIANQKIAEAQKLEEQRIATEQKIAEQRAEEKRLKEQQLAAEQKIAEEKAEEKRLAEAQKIAEQKLAEQKAEEKRLKEQQLAAEQKITEQKAIEKQMQEQRLIAEQQAAKQQAENQKLMEQRAVTEKRIAEQKANEQRIAEMKKVAAQQSTKTVETKKAVSGSNIILPQKSSSKALVIIIAVLIAIAIGSGTYYFLQTRKITQIPTPEPKVVPIAEPEVITVPELSFSSDKPNYLSMDTTAADNTQIKEAINKYVADIKASSIVTPVEFIFNDSQNNPVDFATFSQKIGFTLSTNVLANLEKKFSLFIINDNGNMRIGLAVNLLDSAKLKTALLKEEPVLAKNLSAILLPTTYELSKAAFGKSEHNGSVIRYQNITSPENLSIDYALTRKQLVIGTTKMTLRSILDKLVPATPAVQSENSTPSLPATENPEQPVDNSANIQ